MLTTKVNDFEVSVSLYKDTALCIVHNKIPGIGSVYRVEKSPDLAETNRLIGPETEYFTLLARHIGDSIPKDNVIVVLSILPSSVESFEVVREICNGIKSIF